MKIIKWTLILLVAGVLSCASLPSYAAAEGDTITTTNIRCSQTLGSCTTTTLDFQFINGVWTLVAFREVRIPSGPPVAK